jgi:hypothetical protein
MIRDSSWGSDPNVDLPVLACLVAENVDAVRCRKNQRLPFNIRVTLVVGCISRIFCLAQNRVTTSASITGTRQQCGQTSIRCGHAISSNYSQVQNYNQRMTSFSNHCFNAVKTLGCVLRCGET